MAIIFLRDGSPFIPEHSEELREFGERWKGELTFEWIDGQFWLHSDQKGERPIGLKIDEELERHVSYFKKSSIHKEVLARAIGIKSGTRPRVLDLTAGLLGDTLLFLSMGCEVWAVERHPVVAFLIRSALQNASHPLLQKLSFHSEEARTVLQNPPVVDVIFYDPMFEDPNQKSSPRKEMRIFRSVVGEDPDSREILELARRQNVRRVVVKRPRLSVSVDPGVSIEFTGKATRYDVYLGGVNESNHIK